jgi:hypothetical protein
MSIMAIENVQAHLDDLQREAAQRRLGSAARRTHAHKAGVPTAPVRAYYQVRRVLGARS